jgi:hypothetical protein
MMTMTLFLVPGHGRERDLIRDLHGSKDPAPLRTVKIPDDIARWRLRCLREPMPAAAQSTRSSESSLKFVTPRRRGLARLNGLDELTQSRDGVTQPVIFSSVVCVDGLQAPPSRGDGGVHA